jgi:hypothetical protein
VFIADSLSIFKTLRSTFRGPLMEGLSTDQFSGAHRGNYQTAFALNPAQPLSRRTLTPIWRSLRIFENARA